MYFPNNNSSFIKKFNSGGKNMENLVTLGIFLAGVGVLLAGVGFLWWCSLYEKIKLTKQKKEK